MAEITVANRDWEVIAAVKSALATATLAGQPVFAAVAATTADEQAEEAQLAGPGPRAVVRYAGTTEADLPEDRRACAVAVELLLAGKVAPAADESARVAEALRLKNAAINAVEASPPASATWLDEGRRRRPALAWGPPAIDAGALAGWVLVRLPVTINLMLGADGRH